jgi:hypothetical protein
MGVEGRSSQAMAWPQCAAAGGATPRLNLHPARYKNGVCTGSMAASREVSMHEALFGFGSTGGVRAQGMGVVGHVEELLPTAGLVYSERAELSEVSLPQRHGHYRLVRLAGDVQAQDSSYQVLHRGKAGQAGGGSRTGRSPGNRLSQAPPGGTGSAA